MNSNTFFYDYNLDTLTSLQTLDLSIYSKREQQLLSHSDRFKRVNTYIIKHDYFFVKLGDVRAIIKKDNVLFFFPPTQQFCEINKKMLQQYHSNFIYSILEFIIDFIHQSGSQLINNFSLLQDNIHKQQVDVKIYEEQFSDIVDVLTYFLENENDLHEIADISNIGYRDNDEEKSHQSTIIELENILENGCNMIRDIVKEFKRLNNILENKKVELEIQLAKMRNNIAIFSLHVNIIAMIFSIGGFSVGIFGMNLKNELENIPFAMYYYIIPILCIMSLYYKHYKKLIVQMSNHILT